MTAAIENPAGEELAAKVTADGVRRAAARLKGKALRTPLLENEALNQRAGGRILLKAETLQHCGSFKFRGAYNRLRQLSDDQLKRGVIAWSSGNHGQGVARAARLLGTSATIVMPEDAPALKAERVLADGAEIISYNRYTEDREAIAGPIAEERGLALAPSFDHVDIIHGQGTVGLEAAEDAAALGISMDAFIVCCGGGGLTSGCATILAEVSPKTEVWIAEPEGFDETWASIRDGERRHADVTQKTLCDAIATPTPGEITLAIMKRLVKGGVTITEAEVREAVVFAYKYLKLVVEPGGAVALAAILTGKFDAGGKTVGLTLSGGNIDPALFSSLVEN